jgi:hypothetical protein
VCLQVPGFTGAVLCVHLVRVCEPAEVLQAVYDMFVEVMEKAAEEHPDRDTLPPFEHEKEWCLEQRKAFEAAIAVSPAPSTLRFEEEGITDVVFATGWHEDYSWLQVRFAEQAALLILLLRAVHSLSCVLSARTVAC